MINFNHPIQTISVCSTEGDMLPLRFRYRDESEELKTVRISRVLSSKETLYGGLHALEFVCAAEDGEMEYYFRLKYNVLTHTWYYLDRCN